MTQTEIAALAARTQAWAEFVTSPEFKRTDFATVRRRIALGQGMLQIMTTLDGMVASTPGLVHHQSSSPEGVDYYTYEV